MKNFTSVKLMSILASALLLSSCGYTKTDKSYNSNSHSSKVSDGKPERSISHSVNTMNRVQADNVNTVNAAAQAARNL